MQTTIFCGEPVIRTLIVVLTLSVSMGATAQEKKPNKRIDIDTVEKEDELPPPQEQEEELKWGARTSGYFLFAKAAIFTVGGEVGLFLNPILAVSAEANYAATPVSIFGDSRLSGGATHLAIGVKFLPLRMLIITLAPLSFRHINYRKNYRLNHIDSSKSVHYTSTNCGIAGSIGTLWSGGDRLTIGFDIWVYRPIKTLSRDLRSKDLRAMDDGERSYGDYIDRQPTIYAPRFNIGANF